MRIATIVGARPQFVKASAVSQAIARHNADGVEKISEVLIHTGQHYDANMSEIFFTELQLRKPDHHLGIANLNHGAMTGRMMEAIESLLLELRPQWLLVYGDTNSTLAGALAAAKLHIPVAHVEAGLRSFNRRMPEEVNRVLTDHASDLLLCPTERAVENLKKEGITSGTHVVGDVMYDVLLHYRERAIKEFNLDQWDVTAGHYALVTIHRAENTDDPKRLREILTALNEVAKSCVVILPLHPRTQRRIDELGYRKLMSALRIIEPVSYLAMLRLQASAQVILTDSGGVQKEAFMHGIPCLTLRDETEWVETVDLGWNTLCGASRDAIHTAWNSIGKQTMRQGQPYGDGRAAEKIVAMLLDSHHV